MAKVYGVYQGQILTSPPELVDLAKGASLELLQYDSEEQALEFYEFSTNPRTSPGWGWDLEEAGYTFENDVIGCLRVKMKGVSGEIDGAHGTIRIKKGKQSPLDDLWTVVLGHQDSYYVYLGHVKIPVLA